MTSFSGTAPAAASHRSLPSAAQLTGMGLGVLAFGLFSLMDATVKWLSATYPVHQILFANAIATLLLVSLMTLRRGGLAQLRPRRLALHALRGFFGLVAAFSAFYAFSRIPLADAYAIIFATPLLITALSVPILGERVGIWRAGAIVVGFAGVLIMLRPGAAPIGMGALAALLSAGAASFSMLLVRKLSATESTPAIAFWSNLVILAGAGSLLPFSSVPPALSDVGLFALCGLLGGGAFLILIGAYRRAPATLVAPFQYTQMIWGVALGFLIWGDLPDRQVLAGALVVIASGLFIVWREAHLGRRPTAALVRSASAEAARERAESERHFVS